MPEKTIDATPLGWEVDLLFYFAHAATILTEDIDRQLKNMYGSKDGFIHQKKKWIGNYNDCIDGAIEKLRQAGEWMEKVDPDGATFEAVGNHSVRYSNALAYANEFIRFNMLYMDRAQDEAASQKIFKFLRSLPESGVFPERFLERFRMKLQIVPEAGDRVLTTNHGQGVLLLHVGNKNWNVKLADGSERILNESNFKLL